MNLFDPKTKIGVLRRVVFDLLKEHEDAGEDGLPTNARFLIRVGTAWCFAEA